MAEKLSPGLYEKLLSRADVQAIKALNDPRLYVTSDLDAEDAPAALAQYLERLICSSLSLFRGSEASQRQQRLVASVLHVLRKEVEGICLDQLSLADPLRRLLAIHQEPRDLCERPDTPLSRSALLTGTRLDPSLASQLRKEIAHADRVDILCSFIRWSGLRLILDELRELTERSSSYDGPRLRVITTSYMGATDPKAIEALLELPSTSVRVSYDTKRTRLHAKAYLMHRYTGFGSAYVGSANLSQAALVEGLEWTPKISQYELPYLWEKIAATFEAYWNDAEFEKFTLEDKPRLHEAIRRERGRAATDGDQPLLSFDLHPYPYQEEILDIFAAERQVQEKNRHLLVAATGTGKTMIAAFDYKRWCTSRPTLLFVAHREEILRQALWAFRAVLRDQNFGDLLVGRHEPQQWNHLFCSIQR